MTFRISAVGLVLLLLAASCSQDANQKPAPPDEKSQAEAQKLIEDVYGDEVAAAKTAAAKRILAARLLEKSKDEKDRTAKYALQNLAKELATQAADAALALRAIDEIGVANQIDVPALQVEVFTKAAAAASTDEQHKAIVQVLSDTIEKALAKDDFTYANQLNDRAATEAGKANDTVLVKRIADRKAEIAQTVKDFGNVQQAIETLSKTPNDPQANTIVGKYRCFKRGDWTAGLPLLALSNDEALKAVAKQDAAKPTTSAEQVQLADAWWELAKQQTEASKLSMQGRAVFWYQTALPNLSGLAKTKVDKRLDEVRSSLFGNRKPVNALDRMDLSKNTLEGEWSLNETGLSLSQNSREGALEIPVDLGNYYEIELEHIGHGKTSENSIWLFLPIGDRHCQMVFGWEDTVLRNLSFPKGEQNPTRNTTLRVESNRKYKLRVRVAVDEAEQTADVKLDVDGKKLIDYRAAISSFSMNIVRRPHMGLLGIEGRPGVNYVSVNVMPEVSLNTLTGKAGLREEQVIGIYDFMANKPNAQFQGLELKSDHTARTLLSKEDFTWNVDGNLIFLDHSQRPGSTPKRFTFRWNEGNTLLGEMRFGKNYCEPFLLKKQPSHSP